jgi:hypothetical protein
MLGGTDLQIFSSRQTEPIGTIAIPCRDNVHAATFMSLVTSSLSGSWLPERSNVDVMICQGNVLTMQRNALVRRMRGDWIMFIDDDMAWQPQQIGELIATRDKFDLDIVGGLCFRRTPPHQPTLFMRERPDSGAFNFLEDWEEDTAVEVDATGMAFVLIHKRVFERIVAADLGVSEWTMPSIEERLATGVDPNFFRWNGGFGEDLQFCIDAKRTGSKVYVDTSIEIGHMSELEIRRKHFLIEIAQRSPETEAERLRINTEMGMPTLTAEEAKRRLGW